jgi:hypothetical protein
MITQYEEKRHKEKRGGDVQDKLKGLFAINNGMK